MVGTFGPRSRTGAPCGTEGGLLVVRWQVRGPESRPRDAHCDDRHCGILAAIRKKAKGVLSIIRHFLSIRSLRDLLGGKEKTVAVLAFRTNFWSYLAPSVKMVRVSATVSCSISFSKSTHSHFGAGMELLLEEV